jgi:biotin carboxyl carrier protein
MKYIVDINNQQIEVVVGPDGVTCDGVPVAAALAETIGSPVAQLTVNQRTHKIVARRGASRGAYTIVVNGQRHVVEALDARTRTIRDLAAAAAGPTGPAPLVAPMPGMIVRVNVAAGDTVTAGQGLIVMEAMKMENELRAHAAGTVTAVRVTPGTAVQKGAILVDLA